MKILFLSQFSEPQIRRSLSLKSFTFRKMVAKIKGSVFLPYQDYAIWVYDYLTEFEKHPEFEFHFVGPHNGMRNKIQSFVRNGIHYHFFKSNGSYLYDIINSRYRFEEKNEYCKNRKLILKIINSIKPDLIILCGAENPNYAKAVLDINGIPIYVILQTLLNDSKRIDMGVGTPYRRQTEEEVFKNAQYFCTSDVKAQDFIIKCNREAVFLPAGFPTNRPQVVMPDNKDYDFVFFSRNVSKFKGIEDLLKALSMVKKNFEKVSLNIIGGVSPEYRVFLDSLIDGTGIKENVHFAGYYDLLDDTYNNVVKAKVVTVPGITAGLNSTIREAMLMGLPVICYETNAVNVINREKECLIVAKMEDVNDLANKMQYSLNNPQQTLTIANNGKEYADEIFSNKAIVDRLLDNCRKILGN